MPKTEQSKKHQFIIGEITKNKTSKTVVVKVVQVKVHPKYKKRYKVTKTFIAHDEKGICRPGDKVEIMSSRPYSKTKRFVVRAKV